MLLKIVYIIFILSTLTLSSNGIHISVYNESNVVLTINSKLSELKETLTNEVAKDSDIKFIRAEIERQKKCELDKEMDESLRAENEVYKTENQRLREELDNLKNEKESTIQSLQTEIQVLKKELGQQKTLVINKDSDIKFIRAEIERQKKCELEKERDESLRAEDQVYKTDIQRLREELDNLKKEKESTIQSLRADNQVLREELKQQKTLVIKKDANIEVLKTDIQNLKVDLEKQTKNVSDKEADNQKLRADLKRQESEKPHGCTQAKSSGVHDILVPKFSNQPFKAACDVESHGGGWTIILRRMDGSVNFNRNWTEYKNGFGNLDGEYFLGLDKIHAMTAIRFHELLVLLEDYEGDQRYETYDLFAVGNEDEQYELHTLRGDKGTAGESLSWHRGMKFTTFDKDNDVWNGGNCAVHSTGGWWYQGLFGSYYCHWSHLTGTYKDNRQDKGVTWYYFRSNEYSLKTAIMMIRPKE